jgi:hypothetical protein
MVCISWLFTLIVRVARPEQGHSLPSGGLLKTRCKYIPVRSMAASLRPTVLSNPPLDPE